MRQLIKLCGVEFEVEAIDDAGMLVANDDFAAGSFSVTGFGGEDSLVFVLSFMQSGHFSAVVLKSSCDNYVEVVVSGNDFVTDDLVGFLKGHIEAQFNG